MAASNEKWMPKEEYGRFPTNKWWHSPPWWVLGPSMPPVVVLPRRPFRLSYVCIYAPINLYEFSWYKWYQENNPNNRLYFYGIGQQYHKSHDAYKKNRYTQTRHHLYWFIHDFLGILVNFRRKNGGILHHDGFLDHQCLWLVFHFHLHVCAPIILY